MSDTSKNEHKQINTDHPNTLTQSRQASNIFKPHIARQAKQQIESRGERKVYSIMMEGID
jgi:hypothetical protein